jgi:trehalose synthase
MPTEIDISSMSTDRFRSVLSADQLDEFERGIAQARELLHGRVVWNVNSTARGGGVVELLGPLVAYARGAGVDVRWIVIDGTAEFFAVTKRIHNRLHGTEGDGLPLDDAARRTYEQVLAGNLAEIAPRVHAGDVVILHDPQTAGMLDALKAEGATIIWRCHVGLDRPNDLARQAWAFLRPYLVDADAYVFSRESFAWEGLDRDRIEVIPPTIDVFAPKNADMDAETVDAVLEAAGMVSSRERRPAAFVRQDGTPGRVERAAELVEDRPLPLDAPAVVQISRWDALKDPIGVIRGFAEHVPPDTGAHLVYAGPAVKAVADDPEGARVLHEAHALYERLSPEARDRIHLAALPMEDVEENAIIVNALQRHARVIVQKSLAEGFGLTVAEAMWKARPVVASRIGGIQDQIVDGETGVLLDDPHDLAAYGAAVTALLRDPQRAERIGRQARERVRQQFVSPRSLLDYLRLVRKLLAPSPV